MICYGIQQITELMPPGNTVNGGYVFGGQHVIYVFADEDKIGGSNTDLEYQGADINNWPLKDLMADLVKTGGLGNIAKANFWRACRWIGMPTLRPGNGFRSVYRITNPNPDTNSDEFSVF